MGKYVIKTYEPGFEVEQARIGAEIAKSYLAPHQTNAERLKERYAGDDFDPETRLYAFDGDNMVGFITTRILPDEVDGKKIGNLTPPQVLAKHDTEVSEMLFEKAISILKKKGAQKVRSNFGCNQNKSEDDAKNWGYEKIQTGFFLYELDLDSIDNSKSTKLITEVDFENHRAAILEIFKVEYGIDEDRANTFIDNMINRPPAENYNKRFIIEDEGEVKGLAFVGANQLNPKIFGASPLVAKEPKYMEMFLTKLAQIKKEQNFTRVQCGFTEETDVTLDKYKPIKFKLIGSSSNFEREI